MEIPLLFGRFLVREGKISEEELSEATMVQSEINKSLAIIALENDFISIDEFKKAIALQREEGIRFREALLKLEIADDQTIEKINNVSNDKSVKLGEVLVKKGTMKESALKKALEEFRENGTLELL